MLITEMDKSQCMELLRASTHGRLGCSRDNQPYVVPITYAADGNNLYSFSLTGQKVAWMRDNPKVCVQTDQFQAGREWRSVIAYGRFEELPDRIGWKVQRERAWALLSKQAEWWEPGSVKPAGEVPAPHLFFRIVIDEVTGRHAFTDDQN
ncbi:MAG: pyridoxamine 5'-phosphate oxidase family protein [Rhizobiaceae bacterium]|nr:pyridoxamine 5'-phosphate oxidase family protein [Rhizobiaceae bacterium]